MLGTTFLELRNLFFLFSVIFEVVTIDKFFLNLEPSLSKKIQLLKNCENAFPVKN
jgi:hypothetical protein